MNFKLKATFDIALTVFLLVMVISSAWQNSWFVIMWTGLLVVTSISNFREYSNIQVVNNVTLNWHGDKPAHPQEQKDK